MKHLSSRKDMPTLLVEISYITDEGTFTNTYLCVVKWPIRIAKSHITSVLNHRLLFCFLYILVNKQRQHVWTTSRVHVSFFDKTYKKRSFVRILSRQNVCLLRTIISNSSKQETLIFIRRLKNCQNQIVYYNREREI